MKLGNALIKIAKLRTKPEEYEYHPARRLLTGGLGMAAAGGATMAGFAALKRMAGENSGSALELLGTGGNVPLAAGLGAGAGGLVGLLAAVKGNRAEKKEKQTAQAMALYAKHKGLELLPGGELHEGKMWSKSKGIYAEPADEAAQKEVRKSTPPGYDASYAMRWEKMTPKNRALMAKTVAVMKKLEAAG